MVLYVTEQGSVIHQKNGRVLISKGRQVLSDLPSAHIEQVVVFGNIQITTQAIAFFLQEHVDVTYLSSQGSYRGRLEPEWHQDVRLRQRQYHRCSDPDWSLDVARALVTGKIRNSVVLYQRQRSQ